MCFIQRNKSKRGGKRKGKGKGKGKRDVKEESVREEGKKLKMEGRGVDRGRKSGR